MQHYCTQKELVLGSCKSVTMDIIICIPSSTSTHPSHHRAEVNAHIDSIQKQLAVGSTYGTSNHRGPSEFEATLQEGRSRSQERGRGRSSQLNSQISTQISTKQHSGTAASQLIDHLDSQSASQPINEPAVQRGRDRSGRSERMGGGILEAVLNKIHV